MLKQYLPIYAELVVSCLQREAVIEQQQQQLQQALRKKARGCSSSGLLRTTSRALARLGDYVLHRSTGAKEEGRPSRWKDGLARSFMHCNRPNQ